MTRPVTATYRLQLRGGVDFDLAARFLHVIATYGISHVYLSPIFTAETGSTHGYDITDPTEIDPALGGRAGFEAFCRSATEVGVGVILDIVPNHTAFSVENPWLRDVLRHGADSAYARHFDIDFNDCLTLPWLERPFEDLARNGEVSVARAGDGPVMKVGALAVPLAPGAADASAFDKPLSRDAAQDLQARQPWRLVPWPLERDAISHRRFFAVTGLIGMRVEDRKVFDDMHRLIFDLVDDGLVLGLRIDHVDGLADPAAYLSTLASRVEDCPIWVEKILVGDETLPGWPVAGTTGYEAAQKIAQLLTDPAGHADLLSRYRRETGTESTFHHVVHDAKREIVRQELAAELHALIDLAHTVLSEIGALHGPEAVREAVLALLQAFPRYRSYLSDDTRPEGAVALWHAVRDAACETVRLPDTIRALVGQITDPGSDAARAFRNRIQQVTGAVLAKAHEDTAGFRHTAYLAANEVGADPDRPYSSAEEVHRWLQSRGPYGLTLTSSHDTKRSEDARMRLVAMSHAPDAFAELWDRASALPEAHDTDPALRWYLVQGALALWQPEAPDIAERLADHMIKAAREGKLVSNWIAPNETAEAALRALAIAIIRDWNRTSPSALATLIDIGARLSLIQIALKTVMPGIPDFYGEALGAHFALTDPDNRLPVDPLELATLRDAEGWSAEKARLTHELLQLRAARIEFFRDAETALSEADGILSLTRRSNAQSLSLRFRRDGGDVDASGPIRIEKTGM